MGEEITDQECEALFDSWYMLPEKPDTQTNKEKPENLWELEEINSKIFFPEIENELIEYFYKNPEKLYSIHPRKFEEFVAAIFKNNGFEVELTPETRDGGFDILAIQKSSLLGESKYLIECKRYAPENKVGIGIVQRMLGVVESSKANKGIIATTSSFTRDAISFAECAQYKLTLNDYCSIKCWLENIRYVATKQNR